MQVRIEFLFHALGYSCHTHIMIMACPNMAVLLSFIVMRHITRTPIVAAMVILLSFIACSKENNKAPQRAQTNTPSYGDVFMDASLGDASNLIPILASDTSSHDVAGLIYNGLVKYDKNFQIVPDLAERWDIEQDGKLIRFHYVKASAGTTASP